jgi:hypothetical protein
MRIDGIANLGSWFQGSCPSVPLRETPGMNQTCYRVCPPEKGARTPSFAYWSYLERANIRDANIEPGVLPVKRSFAPMVQPAPTDEAPAPTTCPSVPLGKTGLGGPALGDVPGATTDAPGPAKAPQRTTRLREPGILGTAIDIIA